VIQISNVIDIYNGPYSVLVEIHAALPWLWQALVKTAIRAAASSRARWRWWRSILRLVHRKLPLQPPQPADRCVCSAIGCLAGVPGKFKLRF
jgi:hypothetical protein